MIYYDVKENKKVPNETMKNKRREYSYSCVVVGKDIPYRQVCKSRYGEPIEPLAYMISVDNEEQLEMAKVYIEQNGYHCQESYNMEQKHETNNWLKKHHIPMRRGKLNRR